MTAVPATPTRERVFTPALVVFLLAVGAVMLFAAWQRFRVPAIDEAIVELADGDLDGAERRRWLGHLARGAAGSTEFEHRWAGLLAAIALDDAGLVQAARVRLGVGPVPERAPSPARLEWLALGDPVLRNLLEAFVAEIQGDRDLARRKWAQVAAQSRMMGRSVSAGLAREAAARLD